LAALAAVAFKHVVGVGEEIAEKSEAQPVRTAAGSAFVGPWRWRCRR
jgi:hypothetical protein